MYSMLTLKMNEKKLHRSYFQNSHVAFITFSVSLSSTTHLLSNSQSIITQLCNRKLQKTQLTVLSQIKPNMNVWKGLFTSSWFSFLDKLLWFCSSLNMLVAIGWEAPFTIWFHIVRYRTLYKGPIASPIACSIEDLPLKHLYTYSYWLL